MNIRRRPNIVVLGMMTIMPVGGVVWQTLHYLLGLERLGFEVLYAEDHGIHPSMFTDREDLEGTEKAASFVARALKGPGFAIPWSYHAWHSEDQYFGVGKRAFERALRDATAVLNLHGGTLPRAEHRQGGAFIYIETDPVAPEIELYNGVKATEVFLDAHTAHFTFGENIGALDCKVPVPPRRYTFNPTRQPVVTELWRNRGLAAPERFTTIANWRQPQREMIYGGEVYHWSKHREFMKFLDLPRRTPQPFELALSSYEQEDCDMLESKGWRVRRALDFSTDPEAYRQYIVDSRGEWTVAKDQNVRLRSGWFSDRAATYLASGRPVVSQETGFSNLLPTGCGLFGFSTVEEAAEAIEEINSNYSKHSRCASEIAREEFEAEKVLTKLLRQAGVTLPR